MSIIIKWCSYKCLSDGKNVRSDLIEIIDYQKTIITTDQMMRFFFERVENNVRKIQNTGLPQGRQNTAFCDLDNR